MRHGAIATILSLLLLASAPSALGSGPDGAAAGAPESGPAPEAVMAHVAGPIAEDPPAVELATIPASLSAGERALFELANADRARHGLPPALLDATLVGIARARAAAQLGLPRLSHYDGQGRVAVTRLLAEHGLAYRLAGENLARWVEHDPVGPERIEAALMRSPTHRANILEPSFDRLAVGAATDGAGRVAFAQVFLAAR